MCGKAAKIPLTTEMYEILSQIASSRTASRSIIERASMLLMGFEKASNQEIATQLGTGSKTVGLWRRRWRDGRSDHRTDDF